MPHLITFSKRTDTNRHIRPQVRLRSSKRPSHWRKFALLSVLLSATTAYGQGGRVAGSPAPAPSTIVHGGVTDSVHNKVSNSAVRLRNLQTKAVEQVANANGSGEFSFLVKPDVPYVVEVTNQPGAVLAVSNVVTVSPGAVANADITIPAVSSGVAAGFGSSVGAVVQAAMSIGLTAIEASAVPPVSPER
jgi:hypothetical protein